MICNYCGRKMELRLGFCFDCATAGEERAASRTVSQHLRKALSNLKARKFEYVCYDLRWAFQRLTGTGDYAEGGYFDLQGHKWRHE